MVRFSISVSNILDILTTYDTINIYKADAETGPFDAVHATLTLEAGKTVYQYLDETGNGTQWYETSYYNSSTLEESSKSSAVNPGEVSGSNVPQDRIGWSFGNYTPPEGEWGKLYTADDMRYTMMFGIDCIGSDIAQSEFSDAQFDQIVLEAIGEFESLLAMDIRRRKYKTFHAVSKSGTRSRLWRDGVDYTDEEEPYDFDPSYWSDYGFIQLRHYPVISIDRGVWYSPVKGTIMDMVSEGWIRLYKGFGQVRMFPTGGFTYGPYSVYGQFWTGMGAKRYPGAFEFDYETGYESAEFVPEGLRATIGKYATIKSLAVVGDGILAGFSSQSVSLDGLSESFSSTQSATSAYFGARIKQYSDEIDSWLERNRYKYSPPPMSFVGA
jgi:hypothetical protein